MPESPARVLKNRLRVGRAEKKLSQAELAALAGVTRQTISSIENDQYVPSTRLAFILAECLEQPVTQMFYLEEGESDDSARDRN